MIRSTIFTLFVVFTFNVIAHPKDGSPPFRTIEYEKAPYVIDLPEGDGPFPVIIYVHSWSGSHNQLRVYSQRLASMGIAGVRIDYRKFSEGASFAEASADLVAAIDFVRDHANQFGFDLDKMGLAGASAGAVLSSRIVQDRPEIGLFIAFNGGFDMVDRGGGSFPSRANLESMFGEVRPEVLEEHSAIHRLREKPPTTLLLHGTADDVIDPQQAVHFADAIRSAGGQAEVVLFEGEGHGFFNSNRPQFEEVYAEVERFVLEHFDLSAD